MTMTSCHDVMDRLDDHVDGALAEREAADLESHLAACAACREEARRLRALLAGAAALPREMEPRRDLWPGIAARIAALGSAGRPGRSWWTPAALAAAAAVLMALAAQLPRQGPGPEVAPVPVAAHSPADPLQAVEADYERAAATLAPETMASVERNLAVIDEAMAEVRAALRQDPRSRELRHMLVSTHRKKLDVLRHVVKLST
jgi:anti-sigma factor RsiW